MRTPKRNPLYLVSALALALMSAAPARQAVDASPPAQVVRLVFIHHSTGENWLADEYGGLGRALDQNNYFVSDTNYGWGPNSIGDRTDIPDWVEWFAGDNTDLYMSALYSEGGQNAPYTRTRPDPGGGNEVILFKSCFPNSALEGNADDPPASEAGLSVGGAKYVYNQILAYFGAHPEKLFVVITAPPLSDPMYAANARAFNEWLLNDWLRDYPLQNVAVFDFFTVLSGPDHHHRVSNGRIEHTFIPGANTLVYPSEDDHPSAEGSRKATQEFVPMLNYFYHRWKQQPTAGNTQATVPPPATAEEPTAAPGLPSTRPGLVAGFEQAEPAWEAYRDEATSTRISCDSETGTGRSGDALRLDFEIAADSWGTCARFFDAPQDWSAAQGLMFYFRAAQDGPSFDLNLYAGPPDARETYLYTVEVEEDGAADWAVVEVRWSDFRRAAWEENAGAPFANPNEVAGLAFGLGATDGSTNQGWLRIDEITLLTTADAPASPPAAQPSAAEPTVGADGGGQVPPTPAGNPNPLPCGAAVLLPLALAGLAWGRRP